MTEFILLVMASLLLVLLSKLYTSIIPTLERIATQTSLPDTNKNHISDCSSILTILSKEIEDERLKLTVRGLCSSIIVRAVLVEVMQKESSKERPRSYFSGPLEIHTFEKPPTDDKARQKLIIRCFPDDRGVSAELECSGQEYELLKRLLQQRPFFALSAWESTTSKSEWLENIIISANQIEIHEPPRISSEVSIIRLRDHFESLSEQERHQISNTDIGKWLKSDSDRFSA